MKIIEKIKEAFKSVNAIALGGLLVAGSLAVVLSPEKVEASQSETLWGRTQAGGWVETTPSAACNDGDEICKRFYPQGQNPNVNDNGGRDASSQTGYVQ